VNIFVPFRHPISSGSHCAFLAASCAAGRRIHFVLLMDMFSNILSFFGVGSEEAKIAHVIGRAIFLLLPAHFKQQASRSILQHLGQVFS
jgi:hypothetical protein